ncbi:MAG: glycosyltransferase family 4 protein [Saprospiraceae bacterium]|nr:glycosyltransferase family 4 protein [Saprospiraceae bacterium]
MSKKILYLSYFYEPDLGAGAFRNSALSKELSIQLKREDRIDVITTLPNRYSNLDSDIAKKETINGNLFISRIKVPSHLNTILGQIKSFWIYRKAVLKETKNKKYDLVFASSSKLFTAYLAYCVAKRNSTFLYLDVRDLLTHNLKELFPKYFIGKFLSNWIRILYEKPTIKYAGHLNFNSGGFVESFSYIGNKTISIFPNGIDDIFLGLKQCSDLPEFPKVITYAGNIGEGQGLEKIVPATAERLGPNYTFRIIGSGSSLDKLQSETKKRNLQNVEYISPVQRMDLLSYYSKSHFLFLHLNNFKSFEKVIPSKVFEYAATNIPILAGVAGFPAQFIKNEVAVNCFVFNPCDVNALYQHIISSEYKVQDRSNFIVKYKRENICSQMAQSIVQYLK